MLKTTSQKNRACRWAVALGCGLLLFYLLSLGLVFALQRHQFLPAFTPVVEIYVQPARVLVAFRPIQKCLEWSISVWFQLTDAPDTTV